MKNKIVMTLPARNDLEQIFSYIAEELESPQAAKKRLTASLIQQQVLKILVE